VLNEKVRLLFSPTAVEAEIQVELDGVDTCESIREMARFVKNSPCIVVVGVWRRHQDYVRTSSYSLQAATATAAATTDGRMNGIRANYGRVFNHRTAIGVMHEPRRDNESKLN
jgi:hypothetical protein